MRKKYGNLELPVVPFDGAPAAPTTSTPNFSSQNNENGNTSLFTSKNSIGQHAQQHNQLIEQGQTSMA